MIQIPCNDEQRLNVEMFHLSHTCLRQWREKLKLQVYFANTELPENVLGQYISHWRRFKTNDRFGEILIDVDKHTDKQELFDTIKHEIAHAICDLRYGECNHGHRWIRIAKLMGVKTSNYHGCKPKRK